jgi:hypothetical protein
MTPDTLDYSVVLRTPDLEMLAQYVAALQSGWSPSTTRDMCAEQLAAINEDPAAFIADVQEREGGTVTLPDGTQAPRVPGPMFWIWTANSAARSTSAISRARSTCRRMCQDMSATRSCPGSGAGASRVKRCNLSCRSRRPAGSRAYA